MPSLSQVMMAGGYDWASQTRDVGLFSVTVTSSAEPSGPEPAMVGETGSGNINKYTHKTTKRHFNSPHPNIPNTLRLKCLLLSPALLEARQLYLPVSGNCDPLICRKRPFDITCSLASLVNGCPSFSHVISGTGLPRQPKKLVNQR